VNTIVSLGGFVGPFVIGILRGRSGNYSSGMAMLAVELVVAAAVVLALAQVTERRAVMRSARA
jgi:ACS family tartrate transporter-like MFS transporter